MTAKNDITGDAIKSKTSNENFQNGFNDIDWGVKMEPSVMRIRISDQPVDHPLRNSPLVEIGAKYRVGDSKVFQEITPSYGIAKKCYNDLGPVWTNNTEWIVEKKS